MSDTFWLNVRYALLSVGSGLLFQAFGKYITADQASSLVAPLVDLIIGGMMFVGTWFWGNFVKWGTKTVSEKTGARFDVPTVNPATGSIEK
jgi:hypothetical protein